MEMNRKGVSFVSRDQIEALEMEIAALPVGYISRKTINGTAAVPDRQAQGTAAAAENGKSAAPERDARKKNAKGSP